MNLSSYFSLGATLYTPCNHRHLKTIVRNGMGSKSMVFCTEDSVSLHDLRFSLNNLQEAIQGLNEEGQSFRRYIRPRSPLILSQILDFDGIENIDGFVLPKFDLKTSAEYNKALEGREHNFKLMPTLESLDVMNPNKLSFIRESLQGINGEVVCLRIGGNDLFNLLGIKRMPGQTIYETPLRTIIDNLIIAFRPYGYELSAPVFDMLHDQETLIRELEMDVSYGFFGKTAIHPTQVKVIEDFFHNYSSIHIDQAESVLSDLPSAVFQMNGQMMEVACHGNWARRTKSLANSY